MRYIVLILGFTILFSTNSSFAKNCNEVAKQFSSSHKDMTLDQLYKLQTCVSDVISKRKINAQLALNITPEISASKVLNFENGCPPGPFECVPWDGGGGGVNPVPPAPFFEVHPIEKILENYGDKDIAIWSSNSVQPKVMLDSDFESLKALAGEFIDHIDAQKWYSFPLGSGAATVTIQGERLLE